MCEKTVVKEVVVLKENKTREWKVQRKKSDTRPVLMPSYLGIMIIRPAVVSTFFWRSAKA